MGQELQPLLACSDQRVMGLAIGDSRFAVGAVFGMCVDVRDQSRVVLPRLREDSNLQAGGCDSTFRAEARGETRGLSHLLPMVLYGELMADLPLDRRVHEGLLVAAAGTGDIAQLDEAWQQVCACHGAEGDREVRAQYERLGRETERKGVRTALVQ